MAAANNDLMTLQQVREEFARFIDARKGYPIGNPSPWNESKAGKSLLLGHEVDIYDVKPGKNYDIVFKDDLSTLHTNIFRKYKGKVSSVDNNHKVTLESPPVEIKSNNTLASVNRPQVIRVDDALFFKQLGKQYGGKKTRKHRKSRSHTRRRR